jgi:NAD(P)-dependent dehydrogenase (short-subunit alcohol dehydrogenase family)
MARILLVGASSGIGEATALDLAKAGHDVVATVRTDAAREDLLARASLDASEIEVLLLEVTDAEAVEHTVELVAHSGGLDALVHNAGQGFVGTLEQLSEDELRRCLEVNFFGVVHTVKSVLPILREGGGGHIVVVSSVGGAVGQPFNDAYCSAKFAVEGLLESLHPAVAPYGIAVSIIEPGPVATKFVDNVQGIEALLGASPDAPYAKERAAYVGRVGASFANAQTAEEVARVIGEVIASDDPDLRYQTSEASRAFVATKLSDLSGRAVTQLTAEWVRPG